MIIGLGIDIVHIHRIERAVDRFGDRFLRRVFTSGERAYCNGSADRFAARFAAKEAAMKALGCGWNGCSFTELEIVNGSGGSPRLRLSGGCRVLADDRGCKVIHLSLTHDAGTAVAVVVLES